ncbi:MAG: response regulator transcription factor [Thermomicrobiales bacterium]
MAHLVVVEDERELATLIKRTLESDGHQVETLGDGNVAYDRLISSTEPAPDLIVLDLMLPGMDGLELCRQVRQRAVTPILMLTAKSAEIDKVLGLEIGADDYLTKPVSLRELQARVRSILRRMAMMQSESRTDTSDHQVIVTGTLRVDPAGRDVAVNGNRIQLTAKEFDLIHLLVGNPGRVFSRDYLLDRIWSNDYGGFDRTVDTHILRLRRKLGGPGSPADRIVTLWGVGYKFENDG